jgi:hypothetical protein
MSDDPGAKNVHVSMYKAPAGMMLSNAKFIGTMPAHSLELETIYSGVQNYCANGNKKEDLNILFLVRWQVLVDGSIERLKRVSGNEANQEDFFNTFRGMNMDDVNGVLNEDDNNGGNSACRALSRAATPATTSTTIVPAVSTEVVATKGYKRPFKDIEVDPAIQSSRKSLK